MTTSTVNKISQHYMNLKTFYESHNSNNRKPREFDAPPPPRTQHTTSSHPLSQPRTNSRRRTIPSSSSPRTPRLRLHNQSRFCLSGPPRDRQGRESRTHTAPTRPLPSWGRGRADRTLLHVPVSAWTTAVLCWGREVCEWRIWGGMLVFRRAGWLVGWVGLRPKTFVKRY